MNSNNIHNFADLESTPLMIKPLDNKLFKTGRHAKLIDNVWVPFTVDEYLKHFPNMNLSQFPSEIQEKIMFDSNQHTLRKI